MSTIPEPGGSAERPEPRLLPLASLLGDLADDASARHDAHTKGIARGPVSGLASLDRALGGVLEPGLHVLHGGPGVGKTAFALQLAATCGCPAMVVQTEMRALEVLRRIIARHTETYLGRLKSGEYAPEQILEKARATAKALPHLALADACDAYASRGWLRANALDVRGRADHVFLVVDSTNTWADSAGGDLTEYDRLGAALDSLRILAGQLGCPVLAIAERNRAGMKEGGLHAAAGNRAFEYSAESVLSLDVDDKDPAPTPDEKPIRLRIAKNRNGSAHGPTHPGLKLAFHGALQRFRELEPVR
jgi:replicative DNA helicase